MAARPVLARALACTADITLIRWHDGLPIDAGRRFRTETPALRKALELRDRTCRFPGCGIPAAWTTAHHCKPWKDGGDTNLANLALFCFAHHHYFIHYAGWRITGDPNGTLHFTHPAGWLTLTSPLPAARQPQPP